MAVPAVRARRRSRQRMRVLSSVLAASVLLPAGLLVIERWQDMAERKAFATRELSGIEYARALTDVTMAITAVQSATVAGRPAPVDDLTAAVAGTTTVDNRYGEELRLRERWDRLRDEIEEQAARSDRTPRATYETYREATNQILDLGDRLRDTSGLIRDVDEVVYYLQDSGIEELPEAVVAAGQLVGLVAMAVTRPPEEQAAENAEISVARVELISPVRELEFNLQSAMESTDSRSLGTAAISLLDRFVRASDGMLAAVPADGRVAAVDLAALTGLLEEFLAAAVDLRDMLLDEMESLISARLDELTRSQRSAVVAGALVLLLISGVLLSNLAAGRQPGGTNVAAATARPDAAELALAADGAVSHAGRERSGVR
jgi:hypothetical protein